MKLKKKTKFEFKIKKKSSKILRIKVKKTLKFQNLLVYVNQPKP